MMFRTRIPKLLTLVKKMASVPVPKNAIAKEAVGKSAAALIESGMTVGLGSGTTASYFIAHLGRRCRKEGLDIKAAPTSSHALKQAQKEEIPIIDIETCISLDIAVDGADEVDPQKRMIKGGGGALFREKVIANMSKEFLVIVDETKRVAHLGRFPLAVEISPFAYMATLAQLRNKGYSAALRQDAREGHYKTDNGNYIADVQLEFPCIHPEKDHENIHSIPGVIETGFFLKLAGRILVGFPDKHIEIID